MFAFGLTLVVVLSALVPATWNSSVVARNSVGPAVVRAPSGTFEHKVYGTVVGINGSTLMLRMRSGRRLVVDVSRAKTVVYFSPNRPVIVYGTLDVRGVMHATKIWRTFPDAAHWPSDR